MKNIPLLIGTILGTLLMIGIVAFMFSSDSQLSDTGSPIVDESLAMGDARNVKYLGSLDAESETEITMITIVEFSDFQCPACKASLPAIDQVLSKYPEQTQIIYRHFPLDSIHPNARTAAIASEVAASFGSQEFWDFHDLLFEFQGDWSGILNRSELRDTFADYAQSSGIDRNEFLERMEDNSFAEIVNNDVLAANQLGVNATPTFFVNGVRTSAPQLLATVESLL
jgi:protein-disulfide isomerase